MFAILMMMMIMMIMTNGDNHEMIVENCEAIIVYSDNDGKDDGVEECDNKIHVEDGDDVYGDEIKRR